MFVLYSQSYYMIFIVYIIRMNNTIGLHYLLRERNFPVKMISVIESVEYSTSREQMVFDIPFDISRIICINIPSGYFSKDFLKAPHIKNLLRHLYNEWIMLNNCGDISIKKHKVFKELTWLVIYKRFGRSVNNKY